MTERICLLFVVLIPLEARIAVRSVNTPRSMKSPRIPPASAERQIASRRYMTQHEMKGGTMAECDRVGDDKTHPKDEERRYCFDIE